MMGRAVSEHCKAHGDEVLAYDHARLDISCAEVVEREISGVAPEAVINCAAWTDVDGCERDPARSEGANAAGPETLASASRNANAAFITSSTDDAFDGTRDRCHRQHDE